MKKERSLFRVSILAMVLCVSGLSLTPYATAHEITNIELSPPSPAALLNNEYVNITFDYSTTEAGGVLIFVSPYTDGSPTPNRETSGSYIYPVGSGDGSCFFRIISGDVIVDQIRFRMYNANFSVMLLEFFIDVEYHYGNSITNIELSPSSPATLLPYPDDKVNITFDYATTHPNDVLIFALPYTNGAYTPGSYSSPSPYYPSGKGSGTAWFSFPHGGVMVDEIRIRIMNVDKTVVIYELSMPVSYRFCDGTCTRYVDVNAPGANTGVDWTNAFNNLQDALAVAVLGDEIKVAEGTYKPDEGGGQTPGSRAAAFQLISGVTIRGGYAGWGEPEPDLRDVEVYETILSGDIGTQGNNLDNSYHVVAGSGTDETAYLEGFTITGGYANGPVWPDDKCGGGMYNGESSSPTVINCKFTANTAQRWGAGMFNISSSPTVTNCTFTNNTALNASYGGGGMCNRTGGSPTVTNCTFSNNSGSTGGGMYNHTNCNPTVTDCIFTGNSAGDYDGGGMHNISSSPTIINCTFSNNTTSETGGGMYNSSGSSPMVTNCTFSENSADADGGGMYNNNSSPTVTSCSFTNNSVVYSGGGMYNYQSSPTVADCTFSQNTANTAGGMVNVDGSNPEVTNCTFSGNTSASNVWGGGGMCNLVNCSPTVINCTFTDNTATYDGGGMSNYENSSPTVTNCIFSGNETINEDGGGMFNYNSDPNLTNCAFFGNTAGDVGGAMLMSNSSPTVTNCTFYDNSAVYAGAMRIYQSSPTVTNCILWGNTATISDPEIYAPGETFTVTYSDVEGGWVGTGNINADPCFVDAAGGNLRFLYDSPCIDTGNNSAPGLSATDLAGNGRFFDGDGDGSTIVDMGAYEFGSIKLVAHWRLDESSDGIAYDSISDNDGTLEPGPPFWQPAGGQIGGALEFDGFNDFVSIPNESNFDITNEITVSGWIKVTAFDRGWQAIVTKGDYAWRIQRDAANNALEFAVSGTSAGNILGSVNVNDGQWHHAAGVYDGTMIYLYVDGAVDNSVSASGTISTNDYPVMIGENAERLGRFWNGLLDDVVIFSRALDGTEITNLKNNGGASFIGDPDLKALWKLDESSGTTASDSAGGNHGTLEPAFASPLWQPDGGRLGGALEFDGVDDFVSIPNESRFDITYQLTVSAWIQVAAFDKDWQAIVTKGDAAWRLHRLQDTNSIAFHCNNYPYWGADGNIGVDDGQWHHVAGVYDGTRAYLYVDGVLDNSEPAFGLISTNDFPVMIGENAERSGRCWNGLIDDVRIYTSALSPSEVYRLYNNICYVDSDANGNNDGSSWTDAFNYLQDALAQATSGLEIRIAEGTYKPDANSSNPSGTGHRTATFQLVNGVILKGGYAGAGTPNPNVRDCDLYETTLSGDINAPGDANDNSYHVVTSSGCDPNTVLEGFIITGGNANGPGANGLRGGGMFNYNSSPTVNSCMFIGNTVIHSATLSDRVGGGGMCNYSYSSPTVTNCIFAGNTISVINYRWVCGGGMFNYDYSNPTVTGCTFTENTTMGFYSHGGGMGNRDYSNPSVTNCTFRGNSSNHWGAGMYNDMGSHSTVTNCTFSGNISDTGGGGIGNYNSSPTLTNCILWDNMAPTGPQIYGGSPTVAYSDVQGGYSGTGNVDADPCFVDAAGGNLRLSPGSPCVDKGSNAAVPLGITTDLDGRPRIIDGDCDDIDVVDMGAYEFAFAYVGDFDNNCKVDFFDISILARAWETQPGDPGWEEACDISYPPDDYIDWRDAAVLCENWLATP